MGIRMGRMVPNEKIGIPSVAFGKCYVNERRQGFVVAVEPICESFVGYVSTKHKARMFWII